MTARSPLFTFRQLPTISAMLAERGLSLADLLRDLSIAPVTAEITAPLPKVQALLELVADKLGAPLLGIDLADRIPQGAYGVTEFVVRASPTLKIALTAMCELSPLINPSLEMRYIADHLGCEVRFAYADNRDGLGEILNEYTVRYIANQFAVVIDRPLPLSRAWFAHGRRSHHDDVARRLGCSVGFQAADSGFAVASSVIDQPIRNANQALYDFLMAQARTQLANLGGHDVIAQVTRVIEAQLTDPNLSAATVAQALAVSQRSLQRQLADAGTSYRSLVVSQPRRIAAAPAACGARALRPRR